MKLRFVELFVLLLLFSITLGANPVKKPILNGRRRIKTKFFAQIPKYKNEPSKIVGIVSQGNDLYVTTSTSGGLIYKIRPNGAVSLWFDVAKNIKSRTGRNLNVLNSKHGGLRGLAFHPQFNKNGLFYVSAMEDRPKNPKKFTYFSDAKKPIKADSVVLEYRYSKAQRRVLPWSYRLVIRIGMPVYDHTVRQIAFFGNSLLITHGDGSIQSATAGGGLNNDALGKILRINPLKKGNKPYTIPQNNPFVKNNKFKHEIYAVGFRNPHNICVSKKHGIFVTEAGRDNVEEVNIIKPGRSYGWSKREGTFVHVQKGGGIVNGVKNLPKDDAKFGFTYPNVQVGHFGKVGDGFVGQALAGACPIENSSELKGIFIYANFPSDGQVYYSFLDEMKAAVVQGPPSKLTQALVYRAKILYDHDNNPKTPPRLLNNLRDVVRMDTGDKNMYRADIRFGRGPKGEIFWSSKSNGRIYRITNSIS